MYCRCRFYRHLLARHACLSVGIVFSFLCGQRYFVKYLATVTDDAEHEAVNWPIRLWTISQQELLSTIWSMFIFRSHLNTIGRSSSSGPTNLHNVTALAVRSGKCFRTTTSTWKRSLATMANVSMTLYQGLLSRYSQIRSRGLTEKSVPNFKYGLMPTTQVIWRNSF